MLADKDQQKQTVQIDRRNKLHKYKHKYKQNQLQNETNYKTKPIVKPDQQPMPMLKMQRC
jgi:hypothetical protein